MCGIVAATNQDEALYICELVKARGTRAWSMCLLDLEKLWIKEEYTSDTIFNKKEAIEKSKDWEILINPYFIFHLQSPTARDYKFHPAHSVVNDEYHWLWHNGMIDSAEHAKYEGRPWDTQLLLDMLIDDNGNPDWSKLNDFQGSFACYYLHEDEGLYFFRNAISPQFSDGRSYGSVKFEGAEKLPANTVINMVTLKEVAKFENTYNPFGV